MAKSFKWHSKLNFRIPWQCFPEVEKFKLLACDKLDNYLPLCREDLCLYENGIGSFIEEMIHFDSVTEKYDLK